MDELPNIVLVHGAWANGSSWSEVIRRLQQDGYNVTAPQFPLTTLTDDVARLRQVLAAPDRSRRRRRSLVRWSGHDRARRGRAERRRAGVHVAAVALDEGESIGEVLSAGEPTPAIAHLRIDDQGFAWLPQDDFVKHFAGDIDPVQANVMYSVQQPLSASAFGDVMGTPAWRSMRTWYTVAQNDEAIPPDVERHFAKRMDATVIEVASGHLAMVSHPDEVADLVRAAARSVRS